MSRLPGSSDSAVGSAGLDASASSLAAFCSSLVFFFYVENKSNEYSCIYIAGKIAHSYQMLPYII
jgi:hypothetical protein